MAFIVQDDTGAIADANSYVTVQEFKDYWTDRNVDYTGQSDAVIQAGLIQATSYIDARFDYVGYRLEGYSQTTDYPRGDLWVCDSQSSTEVEGVPREIKQACNEYSKRVVDGTELQADGNAEGFIKKKKEQIGPLSEEIEFCGCGADGQFIAYPTADSKIPQAFILNNTGELVRY
jgi:hypothetical protein